MKACLALILLPKQIYIRERSAVVELQILFMPFAPEM